MMINYDKHEIRKQLNIDQIMGLVEDWGGEPQRTNFGFTATTICHNPIGEGSRKLYYYENTDLFHCYTGCEEPSFDLYALLIKIAKIQWGKEYELNDAVRYIAIKFGISGEEFIEDDSLIDWKTFEAYDRIKDLEIKDYHATLKPYDDTILSRLNYNVEILPWLKENITDEVMHYNKIGYFPATAQITIPHFDINNNFIGLRGRSLCQPDIERYGKYRPISINQQMYNHPLGMNLYNLNNSKNVINVCKTALIFESEKSCLKMQSYFGIDNDFSVACCGSNLSTYQVQLLLDCGAKEIIVAFDRQFQSIGDEEFKHLKSNL